MRTMIVAAAVLCGIGMGCSKSEGEAPAATAPEATTGAEATATTADTAATATTDSVVPTQPEATKLKGYVAKIPVSGHARAGSGCSRAEPRLHREREEVGRDQPPGGHVRHSGRGPERAQDPVVGRRAHAAIADLAPRSRSLRERPCALSPPHCSHNARGFVPVTRRRRAAAPNNAWRSRSRCRALR